MHWKSDNAEIMMGTETDDIINEFFESPLKKYQEGLETKMRGSDFDFESVDLFYYSLHEISLNRGGSYVNSPDWIKHKKATINPKTKDNEYFRDAVTAALNHKIIKKDHKRIHNLKPFFDQYNRKEIESPSYSKDWKKIEQNNKTVSLNILFVLYNTKQIRQVYISKYNHEQDNQVILLIITNDDENWYYLAVKSLSRLLREITPNNDGAFYCLNCFHSCRTKDHDYCCM